MFSEIIHTPIVKILDRHIEKYGVELYLKREDLTDQYISGNKYRKLKYNLIYAKNHGFETLLTFGGAYSNHIHAVAYAGNKYNFTTIGVIRGEETLPLNPTLKDASAFGMKFHYVSRADYRKKNESLFIKELENRFGKFYMVPEGGSNALAVQGCTEILGEEKLSFDHICCACGTGGTMAGIIASLNGSKKVWGFPALKNGSFLKDEISRLILDFNSSQYENWDLILDYHFGGYARYTVELISFINKFKQNHNVQLDPIYTGKLLYGIYQKINEGFFDPGDKIIAIHTGGLQGIQGFNARFGMLIK